MVPFIHSVAKFASFVWFLRVGMRHVFGNRKCIIWNEVPLLYLPCPRTWCLRSGAIPKKCTWERTGAESSPGCDSPEYNGNDGATRRRTTSRDMEMRHTSKYEVCGERWRGRNREARERTWKDATPPSPSPSQKVDDIELPFRSSYGTGRAGCQTCRIQNEIPPARCISTRTQNWSP